MRGKWWHLLILMLAFVSCSPHYPPIVVNKSPNSRGADNGTEHVVRSGETLYSIAWGVGVDYQTLASWNGIGAPYTIYPGQRIRLSPGRGSAVQSNSSTAAPASRANAQSAVNTASRSATAQQATSKAKPKPKTVKKEVPAKDRIPNWHWPVKGKLISQYSPGKGVNGIRIAGQRGMTIQAAASGAIVYVGEGLRGYGKLVLIKHNNTYLSAYAHNDAILVTEGQSISKGDPIARMGSSGSDRVMLHFEIREHGKPIDPLGYLK